MNNTTAIKCTGDPLRSISLIPDELENWNCKIYYETTGPSQHEYIENINIPLTFLKDINYNNRRRKVTFEFDEGIICNVNRENIACKPNHV